VYNTCLYVTSEKEKNGIIWNMNIEEEEINMGLGQQLGFSSQTDLGGPGIDSRNLREIISNSLIHLWNVFCYF